MREDIFIYYIIIEFECGSYYAITKDDPKEKINSIVEDARLEFCDHQILSTTVVEIPKKLVKKLRKNLSELYILYCGCCAFGA